MEKNNQPQPYTFDTANQLADLYAKHVDMPQQPHYTNPTYGFDPQFPEFQKQLTAITGQPIGGPSAPTPYNPQQFGELQNRPQYRGIRMLLPQTTGGGYEGMQEGHIPNYDPLMQMLLGTMIQRGYPVLGGTGPMPGFDPNFNPIGFGQR